MATIGRNAAVVHWKGLQFSGFFAWVAWLVLHIVLLIGFRNRLLVLINWAWDYFLYDRAVRLIYAREIHTAPAEARRPPQGCAGGGAAGGMSLRVLIAGCGYLGSALAAQLAGAGPRGRRAAAAAGGAAAGRAPLLRGPRRRRGAPRAAGPLRRGGVRGGAGRTGRRGLPRGLRGRHRQAARRGALRALPAHLEHLGLRAGRGGVGRRGLAGRARAASRAAACSRARRSRASATRRRARCASAASTGPAARGCCAPRGPGASRTRRRRRATRTASTGTTPQAALAHLLGRRSLEPVYVAVDCEPAAEEPLQRWLAGCVGGAPPRARGGPPGGAGKRCSNRLLLASGYRLRFPTFREGYGALAAADFAANDFAAKDVAANEEGRA